MKTLSFIAMVWIFLFQIHSLQAEYTHIPEWTDLESGTVFYRDDMPNSKKFYYYPTIKVFPYIMGSHEYFNRILHKPWFSGRYYEYQFELRKFIDPEVLKRAQARCGEDCSFLEVPIVGFRHTASPISIDKLPYDSVEVSPEEGSGRGFVFPDYLVATFFVSESNKSRFESFLTSTVNVGLSIHFLVDVSGAEQIFSGRVEFNVKDFFKAVQKKVSQLGHAASPEEIKLILKELKQAEPSLWAIYQIPMGDYPDRQKKSEEFFKKVVGFLTGYYLHLSEKNASPAQSGTETSDVVRLDFDDFISTVFKDVPCSFSIKLPPGIVIDEENIQKTDQ